MKKLKKSEVKYTAEYVKGCRLYLRHLFHVGGYDRVLRWSAPTWDKKKNLMDVSMDPLDNVPKALKPYLFDVMSDLVHDIATYLETKETRLEQFRRVPAGFHLVFRPTRANEEIENMIFE